MTKFVREKPRVTSMVTGFACVRVGFECLFSAKTKDLGASGKETDDVMDVR
jgi:hypothetical protein